MLRNKTVSIASVLTLTVTLLVLLVVFLFFSLTRVALDQVEQKVDVTIFLTTDAKDQEIQEIKDFVAETPHVAKVVYISKEEALAEFVAEHNDDPLTLQALQEVGENPLGATLEIQAVDPSSYASIVSHIEQTTELSNSALRVIDKIDFDENQGVITKLYNIKKGVASIGLALIVLFSAIAVLVSSNTIKLAIFVAREEIAIMRLVGASKRYASGPFIAQGSMYGVLGGVLALLLFWWGSYWLAGKVTDFIGINIYTFFLTNALQVGVLVVLIGGTLGCVASTIAVRRYLQK
jgi:cell division transport system permease protein